MSLPIDPPDHHFEEAEEQPEVIDDEEARLELEYENFLLAEIERREEEDRWQEQFFDSLAA